MKILVINGPNLNYLGIREPDLYGKRDYKALVDFCMASAEELGFDCECFQSNHEGSIVDKIQEALGVYQGIVINPAAYTHTSIAILDLILAGRIFDFGYVFGNTDGAAFWMQMLMQQKSADIASMYEKNHKMFDKKMAKVFAFFEEYEAE